MLQRSVLLKELHKVGQRLASQQAVQKSPNASSAPVTKLENGLTVVSGNPDGPVSRIGVLVNAGSRFESNSNRGISHVVRTAASLSNSENSSLMTTQLLAQLGGSLNISATREHLLYSLAGGRGAAERLFTDVLASQLTTNQFLHYELDEMHASRIMQRQKSLAYNDLATRLLDVAHEASFRGGLANSVFAPDSMMDEQFSEYLLEYVAGGFTPNRMVVSGTGVDHDKLCQLASSISFPKSDMPLTDKSEFISSEVRENTFNSGSVSAALCFPGVSLNDQNTIAVAVLQHLIAPETNIKRGSGTAQGLNSSLLKSSEGGFTSSAFNVNYSDNGLFGIVLSSQAEDASSLLVAANQQFKSYANGTFDDKDVDAAKNRLKAQISMSGENQGNLVEDMAVQTHTLGGYVSTAEVCGKIDQITSAQVSRAAKKVFGGKKSLAVIGELNDYPYLQDL